MEDLFIPMNMKPHNFGGKMGSYIFPVFLTLNELRRYYPEPIQYFVVNGA